MASCLGSWHSWLRLLAIKRRPHFTAAAPVVHLYTWSIGRGVRYIRCAITTVTACRRWPVIEHRALPQAVPHGRQWSRQPCDVASKRTVHRSNSTWARTEPKPERTHIYTSFLMRRAPYVTDLQPPRRARTAECIQRHWSWPLDDSSYRPTQICISSSCFTSSCTLSSRRTAVSIRSTNHFLQKHS